MSLLSPTKDAKKGIRGKTKKRNIKTSLEFTVVCFLWAMEDHMHTFEFQSINHKSRYTLGLHALQVFYSPLPCFDCGSFHDFKWSY